MAKKREDLVGKIFGNREVIANYCDINDWLQLGLPIPNSYKKFVLTKCLNCFRISPADPNNLKRYPPKRCMFCSNISNRTNNNISLINKWNLYSNYAILNIRYNNGLVQTVVNIEDYELLKNYAWRVSKKRNKFYIVSGNYADGSMIYIHQLILRGKEIPEGYEIDHIDGNSLNNKRENLRIITRSDNARNVKAKINNKIGIRGISYNKANGMYKCDFSYDGTRFYFTDFETLEEAVYCRKYIEEYFNLNILNSNPIANQYLTLDDKTANDIKEYVYFIINKKHLYKY